MMGLKGRQKVTMKVRISKVNILCYKQEQLHLSQELD